jgi:hypothetical protein
MGQAAWLHGISVRVGNDKRFLIRADTEPKELMKLQPIVRHGGN